MKTLHCKGMIGAAALLLAMQLVASTTCVAAPAVDCKKELRELVVPPLKSVAMIKRDIRAAIADNHEGIYSVRLFVAADGSDNPDKQVSIGWVNLDVNSMKAFDVTDDPDNRAELGVNKEKYRAFVKQCLRGVAKP